MDGKRVASPGEGANMKKRLWAPWIALICAGALLIAAAGFCYYASRRQTVFPGVWALGTDLSGRTLDEAESLLAQVPPEGVDGGSVTITADGETLGVFRPSQLGAYADTAETARSAWVVGRAEGFGGWLQNGWTLVRGLAGGRTEVPVAVRYDEAALSAVVGDLAAAFDRQPIQGSYELTREGLFATKASDGRRLDQAGLVAVLSAGGETVEAPWTVAAAGELDVDALASQLPAEPSPARYDVEQGRVVDGQVGVELDVEAARYVLQAAAAGETVALPAQIVFPEMTAQELEAVLFRDVLATYTTNVGGSSVRRGNVQLAGASVNGTVLNDGDVFDYNTVVGERTTERGYGAAATYVNGETVDTVGGGICQVSSTIYMTTLLANLEIVERYAHRFYPGYITLGMDATVSWGGPEFQFRNNTGYPIRVDVSYENSKLTVTIVGTKTDDTYVKMTRDVLSTTGYETEYVETDELPYGTEKEKQNGYTGYEVISYRNLYDGSDKLISSTLEAKSSYKSRNRIVLVGTAGAPNQGEETPAPPPDEGGSQTPGGETGEPTLPPEEGAVPGGDDTTPPGWLNP